MSLGAAIIRPQPLTDAVRPIQPADVMLAFVESLMKDPAATLPAIELVAEDAVGAIRDFGSGLQEKVRFAEGKLRNLFAPFAEPVQLLAQGIGKDPLATISAVLESLIKLLERLTSDQVVDFFQKLIDILEKDIGISMDTLRDLLTDVTTRMIEHLQSRVENGETSDEAVAFYDFGKAIDDLRMLVAEDAPMPEFDAQIVLAAIRKVWDDLDLDRVVAVFRAILERGDEFIAPLADIAQAVVDVNASASAGPARPMAFPGNEQQPPPGNVDESGLPQFGWRDQASPTVKPTEDVKDAPIAWYASWVANKTVRLPSTTDSSPNLFDNSYLAGFTYHSVSRETMESMAYHTAWIFPLIEAVLFEATSMERGDIFANLTSILQDAIQIGLVLGKKSRFPWYAQWFCWPAGKFTSRLLESEFKPYWWAIGLADIGESILYARWIWLMREIVLCTVTLQNNDDDEFNQLVQRASGDKLTQVRNARNIDSFDGVCHLFAEVGQLLIVLLIARTHRDQYSMHKSLPWALAFTSGFVTPFGFTLIGFLLTRLITGGSVSHLADWGHMFRIVFKERIFGNYSFDSGGEGTSTIFRFLAAYVSHVVDHVLYLFLFSDGVTDGGTFALDQHGLADDAIEAPVFPGYPDATQSPYVLPWSNLSRMCVEGNMGFESHNPTGGNGQIYACDIEMDEGDELLCSRPGIIVNITDVQKEDHTSWNFVEIMHILLDAPGGSKPIAFPSVPGFAAFILPPGSPLPNPFPGGWTAVPALPAGATIVPAGTTVTVPFPTVTGTATPSFSDAATAIPAGALFPPFWDASGNLLLGFLPPLHPSMAILDPPSFAALPPYYAGMAAPFSANTLISFLISSHDRGMNRAFITVPGASGGVYNNGDKTNGYYPVLATFATYGHGQQSFMSAKVPVSAGGTISIYRSSTVGQVLGQFVKQGQVIMLAGSTGDSAFTHVHMQVSGQISNVPGGGTGANWSIPFVFQNLRHDIANGIYKSLYSNGVPRVFTTYSSDTKREDPR